MKKPYLIRKENREELHSYLITALGLFTVALVFFMFGFLIKHGYGNFTPREIKEEKPNPIYWCP